jgi:hypothetical protein
MPTPRPAMTGEEMRRYLSEVGARLAARDLTFLLPQHLERRPTPAADLTFGCFE